VYHGCVSPILRIIRQASFTPKPWKNGGGITREVIRVPAEGQDFEWRVSLARIDASGPFSDFAGYHRTMVLLEGDGVVLEFAGGGRRELRHIGDLAEFDGALATHCRLLGGTCVDLNLMVSKTRAAKAGVQRLIATQEFSADARPSESTLIFGIDVAVAVESEGGETEFLQPWDLAVISNGSVQVRRQDSGASSNGTAVFFATISNLRGPQCLPV
jgi:environmental stress-induced protein Ves